MAPKKGRRRRPNSSGPSGGGTPKVNVKVAVADADLATATRLVKPALLYADSVTIYSPAASMIDEISGLSKAKSPQEQLLVTMQLIQQIPALRGQINLPDEMYDQFVQICSLDPRMLKLIGRAQGYGAEIDEFLERMSEVSDAWGGFEGAIEQARDSIGGTELFLAIDNGAVKVGSLYSGGSGVRELVELANAAGGGGAPTDLVDEVLAGFVARTLEILQDGRSFPLFDPDTTGLVRAIEGAARLTPNPKNVERSSEVSAAVAFMGFLPHFTELPIDEVLDLRDELSRPLTRFRAATARMSRDFRVRSIDETFQAEAEDAWRSSVEPSLLEVRELLAEHRLLTEVASVSLGDPRRLILEAGGVVAASMGGVVSISEVVVAAAAAGLPALDVLGRALRDRSAGQKRAAENSFYFLHRLSEASRP